ncbi:MAG: hypothetical protein GFH27_549287n248 [Chloroflexi bacterium AL-W]|nr:hypothetical protein [Chloroflexi bacterium AL-N1]NOK66522.1 hypothetical protein [Chloroflexi bacterium AL-N10]NOK71910.1 hypothetical protein [Chloroflexi bacterium AL-N5]NOK81167.1 hypothetical protein [Chloroflexi bacterium AL-W]NOK89440.1 hypothetical protein [Chloroflexi bacterium AL-N15]
MNNQNSDKPSSARMYDYWLGGHHHSPIDRAAAQAIEGMIDARALAQINRQFLKDTVSWIAQQGINQFIDVGSGIPTQENVHEVAQKVNPKTRVVYVDNDPTAIIHSRSILGVNHPTVAIIQADMREPNTILTHFDTQRLIDFSQPVALLFFAMLHFVPDNEEVYHLMRQYRDATIRGSYLVVSHGVDTQPNDTTRAVERESVRQIYQGNVAMRSVDDVQPIWDGYQLMKPGFVSAQIWSGKQKMPHDYGPGDIYGGIGRKL